MAKNDFQYSGWNSSILTPCNVACGSGIMTVNSPSGSTLQCARWSGMTCYWIRPNVRHIGILHLVSISTITAVDMSFCTSLRNFIQIGPPSAEKDVVMSISRWRISAILDFSGPVTGSLKSPLRLPKVVHRDHSSKLLSFFEKIAFLHFGNRQTN